MSITNIWNMGETKMRTLMILIALCSAANAAAIVSTPIVSNDLKGVFEVTYDPGDIPLALHFDVCGENNFGIYAHDATPTGWIDTETLTWDLTVDGTRYACIGVPGNVPDEWLVTDGVRLVNDGTSSYVDFPNSLAPQATQWTDTAITVPESSAVALLLLGVFVLALKGKHGGG